MDAQTDARLALEAALRPVLAVDASTLRGPQLAARTLQLPVQADMLDLLQPVLGAAWTRTWTAQLRAAARGARTELAGRELRKATRRASRS